MKHGVLNNFLPSFKHFRNQSMEWTEEHDVFLCREVLLLDPFQYPYRSKERGDVWGQVAINLNSSNHPKFKVSKRSVRDRLTLLQSRYKEKMKREEMASGIDCEETELDRALEEIIEKEKASESSRNEGSSAQVKKDKEAAEEQRLKAMERLGQTTKRQVEADGKEMTPKKSRRSGSETLEYLRDKFQSESQYKKQELALRVKEQESRDAQQKIMVEQQRQMQQQQNELLKIMQKQQAKQEEQIQNFQMVFLQQQQQQSQILMSLLDKKNT